MRSVYVQVLSMIQKLMLQKVFSTFGSVWHQREGVVVSNVVISTAAPQPTVQPAEKII